MSIKLWDQPFTVAIKDGIAIHSWPDGGRRGCPLRVFRINCQRSIKALAEYDARMAPVFPIR